MNGWQLVVLIQFIALCIALIMPFTPPRPGAEKWAPAELLFADPSYLQQVAVNFVFVELLMAVIALIVVVWVRYEERGDGR